MVNEVARDHNINNNSFLPSFLPSESQNIKISKTKTTSNFKGNQFGQKTIAFLCSYLGFENII
jgi:hypothetical protein